MDNTKKLVSSIPGNNHVVQNRDGMQFYHPRHFYKSPFEERIVPLLISDIVNSQDLMNIYGYWCSYLNNEGYILVKNYPIKHVCVTGRIVGMYHKERSFDLKRLKNDITDLKNISNIECDGPLYFIELCDCSGEIITCILKEYQLTLAGLSTTVNRNIRALVRLIGKVRFTQSVDTHIPVRKLVVISATILIKPSDNSMVEEIKSWQKCLQFKNEELTNIWELHDLPKLSENFISIDIDTDACLDSHQNVIFHKNVNNNIHTNILDELNLSMLYLNNENKIANILKKDSNNNNNFLQ